MDQQAVCPINATIGTKQLSLVSTYSIERPTWTQLLGYFTRGEWIGLIRSGV